MSQLSNNQLTALDYHSDTLEKLNIGLQLLRECKTAHGRGHCNDIAIQALHAESPHEDYITAIRMLAEQATFDDNYSELQDACLLLEDALCELSPNEFAIAKIELLSALNDWSLVNNAQETFPAPSLTTPVNEVLTLSTTTHQHNTSSYSHAIARIEELDQLADEEGYTGLHGVSLLLVEALHDLSQDTGLTVKSDLPALLDNWSTLINAYRQNSLVAIDSIISILRHPDLNIPLEEDDFTTFKTLLIQELGIKNSVEPEIDTLFSSIADESEV
jgi:hypothetical protein